MFEISKAFGTQNSTLIEFFQVPGIGFHIPLYQREYSWDAENIDQLMEDICAGVERCLTDDHEIRFLGSIIRVVERSPGQNINPRDSRAFPARIDNIIDGQQRISTIALLGSLLYQRISKLRMKFPDVPPFQDIHKEIIPSKLTTIQELFTTDLRRGTPMLKPIIIRGSIDAWTLDGADNDYYKSEVTSYLATVIRATNNNTEYPKLPSKDTLVGSNLRLMAQWLDEIEKAHTAPADTMSIPAAWDIIDKPGLQTALWTYERDELRALLVDKSNLSVERSNLCSLVQLLSFTHYLLDRCCFNVIDPISESWAFDMFQSLNATGTPLTALETFKPLVVNTSDNDGGYKGSETETLFSQINELFIRDKTAAQKAKRTDDYLATLAHTFDGAKLAQRFSAQMRWLTGIYKACDTPEQRKEFIRRMANLATYLRLVRETQEKKTFFPGLDGLDQLSIDVASTCVIFLQESGHKMAHTILSLFYSRVLRKLPNAAKDFVAACKATVAFYAFWRSAYSNSGLDNAYRQILKGGIIEGVTYQPVNWSTEALDVEFLKKRYLDILSGQKQVGTKADWLKRATNLLRFDTANSVCKFVLFLVSEDTIPDPVAPGLMKPSKPGSTLKYMTPTMWGNPDLGTLEHIAPQKPSAQSTWDSSIYADSNTHKVGNLMLLPIEINSTANNRNWPTKCIYYMHLAEIDPDKLLALESTAHQNGVTLQPETLDRLRAATYSGPAIAVVQVGLLGKWDLQLINQRTERICEIMWERLYPWLETIATV